MKRFVQYLLLSANAVLILFLTSLWINREGQWQNIHWDTPRPIAPDLGVSLVAVSVNSETDMSQFVSILDRPLFSPSRRPPPPPPPPAPPPPPDPFQDFELFGLFAGQDGGGLLARVEGKVRRVRINETIGTWSLKSIEDRSATFVNGSDTKSFRLVARKGPPSAATQKNAAGASPLSSQAMKQQQDEAGRIQLSRINEFRAKAGLPPLQ